MPWPVSRERPEAALAGLDEALSFWRGDAFAEFRDEWWVQGQAARLEELRLHAREARAEALLGLGRGEAAVSEARRSRRTIRAETRPGGRWCSGCFAAGARARRCACG